ncbi:cobalamin biosynthesis protein [Dongia rigui]|uniref:Cobalamin biosynthesis protein n=1 Tax=Dongia rigui TaxID=940149 RepID=A0ABU5DYM9_9PROT|nr:cobalamin biosynthesis protein [Dongia rigui]MDY0872432.1 cobalamin biosynthesis protein [Dongia rigui]
MMQPTFLGVGHESAATFADLAQAVTDALAQAGVTAAEIAGIATIVQKAEAGLVAALARELGVPVRYFSAAELEAETPRLKNPSEVVFRQMGCHGVAEAAALAAGGAEATLVLPKMAGKGVTCAIARAG